jgi:hypothetical protein
MGEGKAPEVPGRRLQIYWSINFFAKANSYKSIGLSISLPKPIQGRRF